MSDDLKLTADDIDAAIIALVVRGPSGAEAGATLARIAGRAIKILHEVVGAEAAIVATDTLSKQVRKGSLQ